MEKKVRTPPHAVIARSEATWQSVSPLCHYMNLALSKKRRIPTTSDVGHWSRDGGIPRFIDLPPSPFRENDRLIVVSTPICHAMQGTTLRDGTEAVPYGVIFSLLFLFHPAPVAAPATPFPSVRTGDFP